VTETAPACFICAGMLGPRQRKYCSTKCQQDGYRRENLEKVRARDTARRSGENVKLCARCSTQLVGRQLKFCSAACCRAMHVATRLASTGAQSEAFCINCQAVLTGRQRAWCSLGCKRDYATHIALVDDVETYTRKCIKCGMQKPLATEFYKTPTGTYRRQCRSCIMLGNTLRKAKPDAADRARSAHLLGLYGITTEQYEDILRSQGGVCAICEKPPLRKRLSVDHHHTSGLIRGLLCTYCNLRIVGRMTEARLYYRAAEYLTTPPAVAVIGVYITPRRVPPSRRKKRRKKAA